MVEKFCEVCKKVFDADKPWKKECLDCYIKKQDASKGASQSDGSKDWRIARSVGLAQAVATMQGSSRPVDMWEILKLAEIFSKWVYQGMVPEKELRAK